MEPKKMLIYTSLGIFLAGAGGLSAYQFYQKEPTATKAENEEPEKTTDLPKEEAKTVKTDEIRLNTDDNQLIDDKKEETVALETEEPTPIKGFSIKDTVDNIIYVLNPKRVEAQSPIEKLVVDPEDSEFPEEEVPELPRNPEDLLDGIISPKDPEQQPETPELPPNNELPKDEDKPGKGKEPGESKPEEPKEPEHPKPNDPEKPKDPEKPGQPDPEPDPSTVIDLIVDGDTWEQVGYYIEQKDFYNVMYYGQHAKTDQEKFNETVEYFLRNMIDYELNFQERQLFASLNLQNSGSEFLTDYQAVVRESLFKEFVEGEVNLYITRSESDGEQNDADDAKQVVYYVGKYNEQSEDEQLDLPENAKEHLKNAGELLVEGAQVEEDEGNVDRIVEALNKAQIAAAYAPGVKEQAEEAKAQALEQLAESIEPEEQENKEPKKQQKEGNTQSNNNEIEEGEKGQHTPSLNEEQEKAPEDGEAEEEQPTSDPLLEKAKAAANNRKYIQAVMLASESLAKGNTEAQASLNNFANRLFKVAKQSDRDTAEQAFEVLSTTQGVPTDIASQAFNKKKAISYAKKAEEKLDGIKDKDIQTQQAVYREVVNNKAYISPDKVNIAEKMLKEINIYQAAMKQASSSNIDEAIRVLNQALDKVTNEKLKKELRTKRNELSNKQKKTASNREEKEKKDSASDTVTQESNEKK